MHSAVQQITQPTILYDIATRGRRCCCSSAPDTFSPNNPQTYEHNGGISPRHCCVRRPRSPHPRACVTPPISNQKRRQRAVTPSVVHVFCFWRGDRKKTHLPSQPTSHYGRKPDSRTILLRKTPALAPLARVPHSPSLPATPSAPPPRGEAIPGRAPPAFLRRRSKKKQKNKPKSTRSRRRTRLRHRRRHALQLLP